MIDAKSKRGNTKANVGEQSFKSSPALLKNADLDIYNQKNLDLNLTKCVFQIPGKEPLKRSITIKGTSVCCKKQQQQQNEKAQHIQQGLQKTKTYRSNNYNMVNLKTSFHKV